MFVIVFSLLICLFGLAIYCFARPEQTKAAEIGRIMFFSGLLAFLLTDAPIFINLLGPLRR